jgi:hypothetical protein
MKRVDLSEDWPRWVVYGEKKRVFYTRYILLCISDLGQDAVTVHAAIQNGKVGSQNPSDPKACVIYSELFFGYFYYY